MKSFAVSAVFCSPCGLFVVLLTNFFRGKLDEFLDDVDDVSCVALFAMCWEVFFASG